MVDFTETKIPNLALHSQSSMIHMLSPTLMLWGDVIGKHSGRLNMETYSSYQDVKYALKAWQPCQENRSISKFSRLHSPISSLLVSNMGMLYKVDSDPDPELQKKRDPIPKFTIWVKILFLTNLRVLISNIPTVF